MPLLVELFAELEQHLQQLERRFIRPHLPLPPTADPCAYDLDVRAFCMLSHAALEQFIEDVCRQLMIDASSSWIDTRQASNTLLALFAFGPELELELREASAEQSFFEYIRQDIDRRKTAFSKVLFENNGISSKYLRQMLLPVGLNVPDNARWLGSLNQLAKQRGETAHRGQVRVIPAPNDVLEWVRDCLEMCAQIHRRATRV